MLILTQCSAHTYKPITISIKGIKTKWKNDTER